MASELDQIFDPARLRARWAGTPEPAAAGAAPAPLVTPAHRLLDQLEAEARRELGQLGPALENLFVEVRAQLGAAARDDVALGVALDQIEDLLEARLRW